MPLQKGKSSLMAKYGAKLDNVVKAHGQDETEYGVQRVPPGITNGIAKLIECKFDVSDSDAYKGEYYFRAAGMVVEPETINHNGSMVQVAGMHTSIIEMVCDTKTQAGKVTTQEEHVANILNEMRKLGADTKGASGADLESLAAALKEVGPYFRFSTSVRKAQGPGQSDGVWENWHGNRGLEDYVGPNGQPEGGFNDSSAGATAIASAPATQAASASAPASAEGETIDLAALAAAADGPEGANATAAQTTLTQLAISGGVTETQIKKAKSWEEVAGLIEKAGGGPAAEAPAEEFKPEKEQLYKYRPMVYNAKTKKKAKADAPRDVEVTAVDEAKKTVDLLDLTDKKTKYTAVPYDDLESYETP